MENNNKPTAAAAVVAELARCVSSIAEISAAVMCTGKLSRSLCANEIDKNIR